MRNLLAMSVLASISAISTAAGVPMSVVLAPLTVKLPTSSGWEMLRSSESNLVMRREDGATAYANVGRWPPPESEAQFVAEIKRNVEELALAMPNAKIVDARYSATSERPYPCMRARLQSQVTLATAEHGRDGTVYVNYRILSCHSLDKLKHAFLAGYSYIGGLDPMREAEAESFLRGVVMTRKQSAGTK
jgi:hypothetical protein